MKDPLAGRRQDINEGRASALVWPDQGKGCPVEVGQVFPLRSCRIEITRIERRRREGKWNWLAFFARYTPDRLHLLTRGAGSTGTGYITELKDEEQAQRAQDDPEAATLCAADPLGRPDPNLRSAPEPEGVPREEIPNYLGSIEAQQRYELDMAERRVAEAAAPLEERLVRLREMAGRRNIDITSDLFVIEQRIEKAEAKVLERAAA